MAEKEISNVIMDLDSKNVCFEIFINGTPNISSPYSTEVSTERIQRELNDVLKIGKNKIDVEITKAIPKDSYLRILVEMNNNQLYSYEWQNKNQAIEKFPVKNTNSKNEIIIPKGVVLKKELNLKGIPEKLKLSYWKPSVKAGDGSLTDSKFGGMPFIVKGEKWPICSKCKNPLQFFMQLNLETISKELKNDFGKGIMQLFYCVAPENSECYDEMLVRTISQNKQSEEVINPQTKKIIRPKKIISWKEGTDYPDYEEILRFAKIQEGSEEAKQLEKYQDKFPAQGDKLSGWRFKIQSSENPQCKLCGEEMALLFQLFSEKNLEYMFGDGGAVYIFQCKKHKENIQAFEESS